jgi:hypothetical protein
MVTNVNKKVLPVIILSRGVAVGGVWIGNWIYWIHTLVTTNNYDSLTELHTPKFAVTAAPIKSPHSSLVVAC